MLPSAFEIVEPPDGDSPVLVEVPHAGVALDPESASWMVAPARCVARDADLYVDDLFADSPQQGATLLVARLSRYVVDLNRAEDDYDGLAVAGGANLDRPRGVIWRLTSDGLPVLAERLPPAEYQRRLRLLYRPYHQALVALLERKRKRFGFAVMLCAHSMPTPPTPAAVGATATQIADLVPGSRGRTTAAEHWIDLVEGIGRDHGMSVCHDVPYRGGYSTTHYGRPAESTHVVQVEIARRMYMDEAHLARDAEGYEQMRGFARSLVARFVRMAEQEAVAPASRAGVS